LIFRLRYSDEAEENNNDNFRQQFIKVIIEFIEIVLFILHFNLMITLS